MRPRMAQVNSTSTPQHTTTEHSTAHTMTEHSTAQHTPRHSTVQHTPRHSTAQHTAQHSTVHAQHSTRTAQHSTAHVQHSTDHSTAYHNNAKQEVALAKPHAQRRETPQKRGLHQLPADEKSAGDRGRFQKITGCLHSSTHPNFIL